MFTELGQLVATRGVHADMQQDAKFSKEVGAALQRYQREDWGELDPEDVEANAEALKYGCRILAAYDTSRGRIWIITEWDRSYTTILYPSEY